MLLTSENPGRLDVFLSENASVTRTRAAKLIKDGLVKVNGETVATAPLAIYGYGTWDTAVVGPFAHTAGQDVTVGVYVQCEGAGNGAWGKIDDALLNSVADN